MWPKLILVQLGKENEKYQEKQLYREDMKTRLICQNYFPEKCIEISHKLLC